MKKKLYKADEIKTGQLSRIVESEDHPELIGTMYVKCQQKIDEAMSLRMHAGIGLKDSNEYTYLDDCLFEILPEKVWSKIGQPVKPTIEYNDEIYTIYSNADADEVKVGAVGFPGVTMEEIRKAIINKSTQIISKIYDDTAGYRFRLKGANYSLFACKSPKKPKTRQVEYFTNNIGLWAIGKGEVLKESGDWDKRSIVWHGKLNIYDDVRIMPLIGEDDIQIQCSPGMTCTILIEPHVALNYNKDGKRYKIGKPKYIAPLYKKGMDWAASANVETCIKYMNEGYDSSCEPNMKVSRNENRYYIIQVSPSIEKEQTLAEIRKTESALAKLRKKAEKME